MRTIHVLLAICGVLYACGAANADTEDGLRVLHDSGRQSVDVFEGAAPVLRFNHGTTTVPEGIGAEYARGDYIHPLYGPNGEVLTDDYPKDHPHHRGINWSWATIQWRGKTRDLFAVRGVYARPVGLSAAVEGSIAIIHAESVWKWDDDEALVNEDVVLSVRSRTDRGRIIDVTIQLTALVDGLEFCGRLEAGYSGFNARMAPGEGQRIILHNDPADTAPRRSWGDYSAEFPGSKGRAGLAILQHAANPLYPSEWREYPPLNFFQPAYPGGVPISMPKNTAVTLNYRLWVHPGALDSQTLDTLWDDYYAEGEAKP